MTCNCTGALADLLQVCASSDDWRQPPLFDQYERESERAGPAERKVKAKGGK